MIMTPETRQEIFLAAAGGENVTPPTPLTREENYLKAIVDRLDNMIDPTVPTDDGTYVLTCTVSSGTATFSWESAE